MLGNDNESYSDKIGNVIMIPDEWTIVVSDEQNCLHVGAKISIYEPSEDIMDLEGIKLGKFGFSKAILEVVESYEGYAICKSLHTETGTAISLSVSPLFKEKKIVTYDKIPVNPKENLNLEIENPEVSIGDPVKKIN